MGVYPSPPTKLDPLILISQHNIYSFLQKGIFFTKIVPSKVKTGNFSSMTELIYTPPQVTGWDQEPKHRIFICLDIMNQRMEMKKNILSSLLGVFTTNK